jgi:hypothetical protein
MVYNSRADRKIQSFAKRVSPDNPTIVDEPLWSVGRRRKYGGFCLTIHPNCNECRFNEFCPKNFLNINPSKIRQIL